MLLRAILWDICMLFMQFFSCLHILHVRILNTFFPDPSSTPLTPTGGEIFFPQMARNALKLSTMVGKFVTFYFHMNICAKNQSENS